ncbi:dihydrodipicolinate synthase family protein [Paenarthrobacter sp. DKR-5]|uniref:dihydrodipicolinate synthase family protein n=1 Tax=Paenarthrobacter sp. DKR-5 TaxID=2835535 RepID=UPI001BDDBDB3|nr:dihydrodipicolinate synthase family protein [Paenarthrobacter sp. DKR-5]MBT1004283.1 dihydrodipicolinate synthase family protein [Paenarthrobacter sp. DKR-5]
MSVLSGVIPVAPTIFAEDETLDLPGQLRVLDYLVDAGSDGVCILANYSEQFSLDDAERDLITVSALQHLGGRLPVCVATSHYSVRVARARALRAQELGASLVMLMPPFYGAGITADEESILEYFKRLTDGLHVDVMIQDAPVSPTRLSAALLARLAREIPQVKYVKIEMPQTADKLRALIAAAGDDLPGPFDGEEGITLIPDLEAGASGTMSSAMVPDKLGPIVRRFHKGERDEAAKDWEAVLPLIHFENRQCGLRATKALLQEGGIIASDRTRSPFPDLPPHTRGQLIRLAESRDPLILRWA